jgi:hypothetical protein
MAGYWGAMGSIAHGRFKVSEDVLDTPGTPLAGNGKRL